MNIEENVNTKMVYYEHSMPIKICSKYKKFENDEYGLKQNFFDPNKSSPPNNWHERLINRVGNSYEIRQLFIKK